MRQVLLISLAALLTTEVAGAQRKPIVPMAALDQKVKLRGKTRVLYLLRQVDLTQEQRDHARGLIETIVDAEPERDFSLEQVYSLMAEMQEAEAAGDEERKQQLTQQLRALGQPSDNQEEFFTNMESVLTDEQKVKLTEARSRLEHDPSGALRPVDVLRAARALGLSDEQQKHIDELRDKLRQSLRRTQTLNDKQRFQLMNGLLDSVSSELTPEQQKQFDLSIAKLRPDLAYRLRVLTEEREEIFQHRKKARAEAEAETEAETEQPAETDYE